MTDSTEASQNRIHVTEASRSDCSLKGGVQSLHKKMDELITTVKGMKIETSNARPAPASAIRVVEKENKQIDWENLKNIVDLTENITRIRFYASSLAEKSQSVLHCETYYNILESRMNIKAAQDP